MHVYVIEQDPIYRRGLVECLRLNPTVHEIGEASTVGECKTDEAFADVDVVILDQDLAGATALLREIGQREDTEIIVLLAPGDNDVVEAVEAGAAGFLSRDTLTPAALTAAVEAAANGTTVITPGLLNGLARRSQANGRPARRPESALTTRELKVLTLISEGHATRDVAERLAYSERTVKSVLHSVTTKLGARSRSQAVAHAVRDGIIR